MPKNRESRLRSLPLLIAEARTGRAEMLALAIRQTYAELILRGIKPVELRSRAMRRITRALQAVRA